MTDITITLVDPYLVEWMHFGGNGLASVSYGNKRDGVVGPVFQWVIVSGRLRLFDFENKIYEELTLLSRDTSTNLARRRSGKNVKYKIAHLEMSREQRSHFHHLIEL